MNVTRTLAARLAVAALVLTAIAAAMIAALVLTVERAAPVAVAAPAVAPVELPAPAYTADEAFLADLFGPETDTSPEHAAQLVELAHRYCTFVVEGQTVPGAEVQTREGWIAGLTMPADPHAFTASEAGKLLDVAEAAYCPSGH